MADAHGSGPCVRKDVRVQLPPRPPAEHVRGTRSLLGGHRVCSGGPSPPDPQPGASPPDPHLMGSPFVAWLALSAGRPSSSAAPPCRLAGLPRRLPRLRLAGPSSSAASPSRLAGLPRRVCRAFQPADASCQAAVHPFQPSARREGGTRAARSVRLGQVGSSAPGGHLGAHISGPRWVLPASGGALSVIRSWGGVLVQPTTVGNRWAVGRTGPPPVGCYSTGGPRPGSAHAA
jgi:hypothetical protein